MPTEELIEWKGNPSLEILPYESREWAVLPLVSVYQFLVVIPKFVGDFLTRFFLTVFFLFLDLFYWIIYCRSSSFSLSC